MKSQLHCKIAAFGNHGHTDMTQQTPIEKARYAGPLGAGDWPGWESVYTRIAAAADKMGADANTWLSEDHIETMADLGSGHEVRMKTRLHWLIDRGWIYGTV